MDDSERCKRKTNWKQKQVLPLDQLAHEMKESIEEKFRVTLTVKTKKKNVGKYVPRIKWQLSHF